MIDDLKAQLAAEGIDVSSLRPMRDIAVEGHDDLASLELTDLEDEYPIYTLAVSLVGALPLCEKLRALTDTIGHYPVILGEKSDVGRHWESREDADFPDDYLEAARAINASEWLDRKWQETLAQDTRFAKGNYRGQWPDDTRPFFTTFDLARFYWNKTPPNIYIALLETTMSWQVPAYIGFGCWNDCPCPAEQVAIHQHWEANFQTEIMGVTADTLVCRVGSSIKDKHTALQLAREQIAYCGDNFNEMKTLDIYAAQLVNSTHWLFWWD